MDNNSYTNPAEQSAKLKHRYKKLKSRKALYATLFIIILILSATAGLIIYYFINSKSYMPCSSDKKGSVKEAISKDFDLNSQEKLKSLAEQIKKQNNYMNDANCLVVLSAYEISNNNYDSANNYITKLDKIKQNSYKLDSVFGKYGILNINDLKTRLQFIKLQRDNLKNNARYF